MKDSWRRVVRLSRVAATLLAVGSCARGGDPPGPGASGGALVAVDAGFVRERTLTMRVQGTGQWKAANEIPVTAPFAAFVEALAPQPGDRVKRGVVLGWLSTRESRAAVRGAEAMVREAADSAQRIEAGRALELTRRDLVRVPLLSPADGIVTRRSSEPGVEVPEGAELLRMIGVHGLVFEAHVPLQDIGRIAPGQPAAITMLGGAEAVAVVTRVLPTTSAPDQSALVWLSPASSVPDDLVDRFGVASVLVGGAKRVLAVPDSAISVDDLTGESRVVRIGRDGLAIWTPVRLGAAMGGWHELLEPPLPPGTAVVTTGLRGLPDSTKVRIAR